MNIEWRSYTERTGSRLALLIALTVSACGTSEALSVDGSETTDGSIIASIRVSPDAVEIALGESQQLTAKAYDASGEEIATSSTDYEWSTTDGSLISVSDAGEVTALAEGSASATATLAGHSATALVVSFDPDTDPLLSDWDRVLEDGVFAGDVVVPDGEVWLIGPGVEVDGNVIVRGTLAMRPGSSLKFLGANPDQYVGGGLTFGPEFSDDIGLWVTGEGALDIQGTPKQGWNRTGTHSTWDPSDEYWIAPTTVGELQPRRWFPGDPIPQIDPRVPAAEVANVTRDVVIEGPGHIHIHSSRPQRIEYVRIEGMGVLRDGSGPVLGRYALHLHVSGDGTRGTIIQGVALVNSKGRGFVPHASHGITMTDNVAINTWADAFWWDKGDDTNDLLVDRMAVLGVNVSREINGGIVAYDGFLLGSGFNMEIRNSVAAGVRGSQISVGFHWVSGGQAPNPVWIFETGNVAHNNQVGLRFWTNLHHDHPVRDFKSYRNEDSGIENGAYINRVSYSDVVLIEDRFHAQANSKEAPVQRNERVVIDSPVEAIRVGHRKLSQVGYSTWVDCELSSGEGYPLVYVTDAVQPWHAHFIRCGITPDDIEFESYGDTNRAPDIKGTEGSRILIDHADGRKWEIRIENNQRIVVER